MNRRKAEARNQLKTLKDESEFTINLVKKLVNVCSTHVSDLEELDSKTFRANSKYFLAVLQFQSVCVQKIIEWNIDLEELLSEKDPVKPNLCGIINSTNQTSITENEFEAGSESSSPIFCPTVVPYTSKTESLFTVDKTTGEIKAEQNNVDKVNVSLDTDVIIGKIKNNIDDSINISASTEVKNVAEKPILDLQTNTEIEIYKCLDSKCNTNPKPANESLLTNSSLDKTIVGDSNVSQRPLNFLNDSFSSSEYFSSVSDEKKSTDFEDASSYAEFSLDLEGKRILKQSSSSNISERLRTLPMVSLQDRFLENLPKAPMPDLALRPVSEVQTSKCNNSKQLDLPVSCSLTLENIHKAFGPGEEETVSKSKVTNNTFTQEFQEYKNAEDLLSIDDRIAPRVGDICMIGYAESPSEIYIQVADENSDSLDVLSIQLSEICENTPGIFASKTDALKKLGNFWALNYDNCRYRVEVLDWMLNSKQDEVLVKLIDYGGKYKVSYKDLQPLHLQLRNLPRMAQLCHLACLYPLGSTKDRRLEEWSQEANRGFYEVLGNLDCTTFRIVYAHYCNERNSYEIDLIRMDEINEYKTIGQILIDCRLAVEITDEDSELPNDAMKLQIQGAHGARGTPEVPLEDLLEAYFQENVCEEAATITEAVMHYDPQDQAQTCKNLRPDGTCYKGKSCKFRHIPLRDGFTRDKELVYNTAFTEEPLPCTNDEIDVIVCHIVDVRCFYVQIRRNNQNRRCSGPTLSNLINNMNSPEVIKTYKKLLLPPIHGQMVIAKHWNTYWYRGQVRNVYIPEEGIIRAEVFIVDFGDILEVPMSDIRTIKPEFLSLSFQAVECRLYNVKYRDGSDPTEARKHLERHYLGQTFKAKIMSVPGYLEVLLENDNGEDIGLKLIEDGFGALNDDHFFPADDEHILID